VREAVTRSGDTRGLIRYINMCCDLLFDVGPRELLADVTSW